jgi:hypothetical protein
MRPIALVLLMLGLAFAQPHKPFQAQSPASVVYSVKDGQQTVEITNVSYEVTGRLLLRTTTRTKQVIDEIGMEASTTVEAWPLGVDPIQKPLYALKAAGVDAKTVDGALLVILRGLEETPWWSVYKLDKGERLFDSYVPLLGFSIRRDIQTMRYVGLEVPEDDVQIAPHDARLKEPHVVAVLTYASAERVLRDALITSDDPNQAQTLRSFADATRSLTPVGEPVDALKLSISQNYPSRPATMVLTIPIERDDLALTKATMPPHLHIALFKR